MNITQMARKAHQELVTFDYPGHTGQIDIWTMRLLERFAALVVAAEREECAKVVEINEWPKWAERGDEREVFADAIRARGQK